MNITSTRKNELKYSEYRKIEKYLKEMMSAKEYLYK